MILGRLLEIAVMLLLLVWIVTQILTPLLEGTALFPIFRRRRKQLLEELTVVKTAEEDRDLQDLIARLRKPRPLQHNWRDDADED